MAGTDKQIEAIAAAFAEHRGRLLKLAARNLNPVLSRRVSPEDVVGTAFENAVRRLDYFADHPEVPVYFKLRTILLQTVTDCERRNLQSQKRDAYKEAEPPRAPADSSANSEPSGWDVLAASVTSPRSVVAREDRYALLRRTVASLPEPDRQILTLRHFDGLSNLDCAAALGIEPKAASIRYVRALRRLQSKLVELSEFRP